MKPKHTGSVTLVMAYQLSYLQGIWVHRSGLMRIRWNGHRLEVPGDVRPANPWAG